MIPLYQQTIGVLNGEMANGRVLEVGSAKGYFLAVLKKMGWDGFGIEISAAATQFAREKLNVPSYTGTLEKYVEQEKFEAFPLVLAFDLLEHVTQPEDFIRKLNHATQTGGTVIFTTPNAQSANIPVVQAAWSGFNPFHIYLFSQENISRLLKKHRFEIQTIFSYNNSRETPDAIQTANSDKIYPAAKTALKKMKLMNYLKNVRLKIWQFQEAKRREACLNQAANAIQQQSNYFSTPDSRAELAKSCEGDNLVVIAKKM